MVKVQRGFTLIELVVVIVILGILAAFAVPRFMGMEGEARAATVRSMSGTLRSAASMARGVCQAQGCGLAGTVSIEGRNVVMANGYPDRDSIVNTLQSTEGFTMSQPTATSVQFNKVGAGTNCWVRYTNATATNPPAVTFANNNANEQTRYRTLANNCR